MRATKNEALYSWEEADTTEHEPVGARLRAHVPAQGRTRARSAVARRAGLAGGANAYAAHAEQVRQPKLQHEEDDALWQRLRAQAEAEPEPRISTFAPAGTYVRWEQYAQSANDHAQQHAYEQQAYAPQAYAPQAYAHQWTHHFSDEGVTTKRKGSRPLALAVVLALLAAGGAVAYGESRATAPIPVAGPATTIPGVAGADSFRMGKEEERAREALLGTHTAAPEESPASSALVAATSQAVGVPEAVAGPETQPRPAGPTVQPEPTAPESDVARASERAERRKARRAARRALAAQRAEGASETERGSLSDVIDRSDDPLVGI